MTAEELAVLLRERFERNKRGGGDDARRAVTNLRPACSATGNE